MTIFKTELLVSNLITIHSRRNETTATIKYTEIIPTMHTHRNIVEKLGGSWRSGGDQRAGRRGNGDWMMNGTDKPGRKAGNGD
ncbi:hypothetical protein T02_12813 [Trichinella nativa]|uniref:Uncharacterized protein n=2 Tax=Trichinella TaxID=6333 RepID=A0A0V1LTV5_9BILA|nr:hypothetical protein T06_9341 [Trichinella sp. T6]KRY57252.1 hypothetical protein T03_2315 [Trichinella britovi]KRZ62828.1 hypothetical protein T02_12813 [Trichinella nativa]KRZ93006.1 hypothetical protein T08_9876 [Trichinella sp. T8]